jgi:ribosomal protein S18 acetylase RimI-like enzyme
MSKTADVTVRPKRATDDAFVLGLSQRVFAAYSRDPLASMSSMLEEHGAEASIAQIGRTRAGFVLLAYERLPRSFGPWQRPVVARLNAIAVRPDIEGRGIGRALLVAGEEMARAAGAASFWLLTAENNLRARRLFESAGFLPVVRSPTSYARGQAGITMFKLLDL